MTLYVLSGLGADARVFGRLQWPAGVRVEHVAWIPWPMGEAMTDYARRLSAIVDTSSPYALAGLSLGGMLATEMSTFLQPAATLLLSSAPSVRHLPPWFRTPGLPALQRLLPPATYRFNNPLLQWLFGLRTAEEKVLFASILRDADPRFVHAAIRAVLTWERRTPATGIHVLHGSADRLLPARYAYPGTRIAGAGHLAVFTHAPQVSAWLSDALRGNLRPS